MSDEAEERIFALLGRPDASPYGTPIPSSEVALADASEPFLEGVRPLSEVLDEAGPFEVRRLGEPVQADREMLSMLRGGGVFPGASVTVERSGARLIVSLAGNDAGVIIPADAARHIYVAS